MVRKGKSGAEEIQKMMEDLRQNPPVKLNDTDVIIRHDYLTQKSFNLRTNSEEEIMLPKSNVLQFILEDGSKISVRPSGTEPKIKFYFSVNKPLPSIQAYNKTDKELGNRIENIKKDLGI